MVTFVVTARAQERIVELDEKRSPRRRFTKDSASATIAFASRSSPVIVFATPRLDNSTRRPYETAVLHRAPRSRVALFLMCKQWLSDLQCTV